MSKWRPHSYRSGAQKAGIDPQVIDAAVKAGKIVVEKHPDVPPIFSLRHLAYMSGAPYLLLREIVERERDPYSVFTVRKRSNKASFRTICVPTPPLMQLQRWLAKRVLNHGTPHSASTAFAPKSTILEAAEPHAACRWLVKVDVRNFFESVSEIAAYRVFQKQFGFQKLISMEMARLCTRVGNTSAFRSRPRWKSHRTRYTKIPSYRVKRLGHLPQGAPTSPMLANLAVKSMDDRLQTLAETSAVTYTRYADDLFFSTINPAYTRKDARALIVAIYRELRVEGFSPNTSKTAVSPPGARKIVLGLSVDGDMARLSRAFKQTLRLHIYHCKRNVAEHASARKFSAIAGLENHLRGLLAYAHQIEPDYAAKMQQQFDLIVWPI